MEEIMKYSTRQMTWYITKAVFFFIFCFVFFYNLISSYNQIKEGIEQQRQSAFQKGLVDDARFGRYMKQEYDTLKLLHIEKK